MKAPSAVPASRRATTNRTERAARGEEDAGHDSQGETAQQEEPDVAPVGERREEQLGHQAGQERGCRDDTEAPGR